MTLRVLVLACLLLAPIQAPQDSPPAAPLDQYEVLKGKSKELQHLLLVLLDAAHPLIDKDSAGADLAHLELVHCEIQRAVEGARLLGSLWELRSQVKCEEDRQLVEEALRLQGYFAQTAIHGAAGRLPLRIEQVRGVPPEVELAAQLSREVAKELDGAAVQLMAEIPKKSKKSGK